MTRHSNNLPKTLAKLMPISAITLWVIVALVLFAFSLIAVSIIPNKYQFLSGIDGAVDCDGPLAALIFGMPSLIFCSIALLLFPRKAWLKGVFGCMVPLLLIISWIVSAVCVAHAIQEQQSLGHQEVCGDGL